MITEPVMAGADAMIYVRFFLHLNIYSLKVETIIFGTVFANHLVNYPGLIQRFALVRGDHFKYKMFDF